MPMMSMPLSRVPTEAELHLLETLEHGGCPVGQLNQFVATVCFQKRWIWAMMSSGITFVFISDAGREALARAREGKTA